MSEFKHIPVLFNETIDALNVRPDGIYVDCTAGGGGHCAAVAERLTTGRIIAIDQDPEAVANLQERFKNNGRVTIVHDNFVNISSILENLGIDGVDGIMADLGVSSHQLDTDERGFSFHKDAPLDMRMSMEGMSAADLVNTASQSELQKIIYTYGEEKFAPSIARNIVKAREKKPIETTFELVDIIKASMPMKAKRDGHPARKTFQALRIEVNGELEKLERALDDMFEALNPSGRIAIITFHSLEDRIVKKKFNKFCEGCICPPEFPVCVCGRKPRGKLPFKSKAPTENEVGENFRAHSARLRAIEKI
ncbi:MAG: 16S rRNA (cytosine(1402)-N(4))-methyltransferase RsmH [Oscillospiraceae bacterium]|jgi:16S rRNA (cytosine1402-N4)-methyltransferase|nr:16S rRNA (cytosine(1402)-N(4))-methyltransferase RsmH [Oscillospiraceae bacterium]CDA18982.1 ribosomal RNA small subunit methyltransferase H [Ruminococcus sp. CAG:488]HBM00731.1 16S rRNA (cytosine(1402)-N(4))-methyltransferase RsmH [Oscillospiraceae bacterium]